MRSSGWALIQDDWCPYKKRRHTRRRDRVKTRGEKAIYKPRREATKEANPANTRISGFQPLELGGNKLLLSLDPVHGAFFMAAPLNQHKCNSVSVPCHPHVINSFLKQNKQGPGTGRIEIHVYCARQVHCAK